MEPDSNRWRDTSGAGRTSSAEPGQPPVSRSNRGRTVPSDNSHICSASPTRNKCVIISAMFNEVYISKQGGAGVWSDACSSDRANSSMLTINASVHMLMLT